MPPSPDVSSSQRAEERALVALSMVPGVGPGRIRSLVARLGSGTAVLEASTEALCGVPGIGKKTARAIREFDADDEAREQVERARRANAALITTQDERFPKLLRQIYDPPAFMWMRGALQPEDERALAVVGTRRCSDYGRRVAEDLTGALARRGFTIVSGLAYGIDAAAHRAALEAGGRTVARRIIEGPGAVLSEFPMGADPDAANFPRRNRIVSGMALGALVVESPGEGGALITARLAVEQNREVFAAPSSIYNDTGEGCNRLIQRGHAKLVLSVEDVLEELNVDAEPDPTSADAGSESEPEADAPALNDEEERLMEALGREPEPLDVICERSGMDASAALVHLLQLEFKGLVRQLAGKQFCRST
ncbi:MAG: DNA-protecting protein DprA [Bacteroidetes bacterium QS_8_64_10]|nr:MAG: DNA-protecting protein DprA [Bacteroidetes bacterium QS_8_64_10]